MNKKLTDAYQRHYAKLAARDAILGITGGIKKPRRMMEADSYMNGKAVHWLEGDDKGKAVLLGKPEAAGLRLIDRVAVEFRYHDDWHQKQTDHITGWYTDLDGWHGRNGEGLVWGEVYQLPARRGKCLLVPAYHVGDSDEVVLDFSRMDRGRADGSGYYNAGQVARIADGMAESYSEDERQYQWEQRELEEAEEDEDEEDDCEAA